MVWDADRLLPSRSEKFGAAGVVVVIAHEVGHAVHRRLGIDAQRARNPARYPTILLESMADCYAGVALATSSTSPWTGLPIGPTSATRRCSRWSPSATRSASTPADASAHGNAFDRVSAFQTGYAEGAGAAPG